LGLDWKAQKETRETEEYHCVFARMGGKVRNYAWWLYAKKRKDFFAKLEGRGGKGGGEEKKGIVARSKKPVGTRKEKGSGCLKNFKNGYGGTGEGREVEKEEGEIRKSFLEKEVRERQILTWDEGLISGRSPKKV